MKKFLVVVCALAFCVGAANVHAQVPYVQVYFDQYYSETTADCPGGGGIGTLWVVAHNWNMWMNAIEYRIVYPAAVTPISDNINLETQLALGSSETGIAIVWTNIPGKAFDALLIQTVSFEWTCDGCTEDNAELMVVNYDDEVDPLAPDYNTVRALQWPDDNDVFGVGMTSLVCATVPVNETTWGNIKAQYDH
jgi:hypothetical protein